MLLIAGCSQKVPNTWQHRIMHAKPIEKEVLHVDIYGKGKPVVLLHGFGASSYSFSRIIPELSKQFRLYAIDLKGFGKASKPDDPYYSVYDQAVLVEDFLRKHHLRDVVLIGHSYGGGVALSLALIDPARIKKMVLIDAAVYKQQLPKLLRWLQMPVLGALGFYLLPAHYEVEESYRYAFYDDSKIPSDIVQHYAKNLRQPGAKRVYLKISHQLIPRDIDCVSKYYKSVKIPTLIIWGANDIVVKKDKAYRLHHDLQNSQLVILPRCGHIPHEECPEKVIDLLEKFMLK
jgi:pimeloyl-ACP methyl ester carboxylesterase